MPEAERGEEILRLTGLRKSYNVGLPTEVEVLHGLNLEVPDGDFVWIFRRAGICNGYCDDGERA